LAFDCTEKKKCTDQQYQNAIIQANLTETEMTAIFQKSSLSIT